MKNLSILAVALWLSACGNPKPTNETTTPQVSKDTTVAVSQPKTPKDEPLALPTVLAEFTQKTMPTWKTPKPSQWLSADYVASYNQNNSGKPASFTEDMLIKGDFNGDKKEDYACFLINEKNEVAIWAFHQKDGGFDAIQLSEPSPIEACCIGEGLATQAGGVVIENPFYDKKEKGAVAKVDLKHDAITTFIYEKTATLHFWNGKKYQSFLTAD